jgi:hypothetical protein
MAETRTNMSGGDAIVGLPELLKRLNAMRAHLADEADQVAEEWEGLRRVGGNRDDHGVQLLQRLRPHLREISEFTARCVAELDRIKANPFGD